MIIGRIMSKTVREFYRLFHPFLWNKRIQINGIPQIYDAKNLAIGKDVSINDGVVLQSYGGISIGNNVTISRNVTILTIGLDTADYIHNSMKKHRDHIMKKVIIQDGTWLCANVTVLPGVKIASCCIVAAGAVVTHDLNEENCIYGGVPAKLIKRMESNHD